MEDTTEITHEIVDNPITGVPERVAVQKESRPAATAFSPFATDEKAHHGTLEIEGGTYFYRLPSPELQECIDTFKERAAASLGMTLDEYEIGEKAKAMPNAGKTVQVVREAMWQRVIDECIVAWSYDVPCDSEHKAQLIKSVRRAIATNIISDSDYGVSEINFFRELDLATSVAR